jgi:hypothetical protein
MSVNKEVRIKERVWVTLRLVALNFPNHPFFDIGNPNPTSTTFGQITGASGTRTMQCRAALIGNDSPLRQAVAPDNCRDRRCGFRCE